MVPGGSPENVPDGQAGGGATPTSPPRRKKPTPEQVLVVTGVMFTFISFWRTAAIVLCGLASTALNTRCGLRNAPRRVILGLATKTIHPAGSTQTVAG